ncbi:MAG TPA: HAD-IIIA family hydrolase, partial [Spirochaetota bacterium]|nr:HAD-IIIA family hydrolase [Spirochaetota bacterium]
MNIKQLKIDKNWTLFLDRDGVINKRLMADYVKTWDEFVFLPGVLVAINGFTNIFKHIFVVTNQQGIGKKIMTLKDFETINAKMLSVISDNSGKIDNVYFCPHLKDDNCECRKPKTGMFQKAKNDYPDIDMTK